MELLLIEDEPKTSNTLKAFLTENGITCTVCISAEEAIAILESHTFDVIVSDILMSGMTGLDLTKLLRNLRTNTPILLISALSDTEEKIKGLEYGADDYLPKPFNLHELLARIKALYRRSQSKENYTELLRFGDIELNLSTLEVTRQNQKIVLSPKEFNLLVFFIRNHGRVLSKAEILEKVWNLGQEINTNVIEVYVNYLRKKIDKNFEPKYIHTHFGIGYVLKLI